jgi:hypothetical protein
MPIFATDAFDWLSLGHLSRGKFIHHLPRRWNIMQVDSAFREVEPDVKGSRQFRI